MASPFTKMSNAAFGISIAALECLDRTHTERPFDRAALVRHDAGVDARIDVLGTLTNVAV